MTGHKPFSSLMTPMTEIMPRLWVGTQLACEKARERGWKTLCVLESPCHDDCKHMAIAVLEGPLGIVSHVDKEWLDKAVHWLLNEYEVTTFEDSRPILVHCAAGMERSPLVVAHFLTMYLGLSLDEAYDWLQRHRPQVQDRRAWVKRESYQLPDEWDGDISELWKK